MYKLKSSTGLVKEHACATCGVIDNLYVDKKGITYNQCITCRSLMYKNNAIKSRITYKEKTGFDNPSNNPDVANKKIATNRKNRNVDYPTRSQDVKDKIKATVNAHYNVDNVSQAQEVKDLKRAKSQEKYNTNCTLQAPEVYAKSIETMLRLWDVDHPQRSVLIRNKTIATNMYVYGTKTPAENADVLSKMISTNISLRGVSYVAQDPEVTKKGRITHKANYWDTYVTGLKMKGLIPQFDIEYFKNNTDNYTFKCTYCNKVFVSSASNVQDARCTCTHNRSSYEKAIASWLESIGIIVETNKRYYEEGVYKYEIDVFLPEYNLGIDFHGLFWHCDLNKSKSYHQDKYLYFKDTGVAFIQVFEDEWVNKQDIVKSIILSKIGKSTQYYQGRKCNIRSLSFKETSLFLEQNHLQGACPSKANLGLYNEEELVAVMTFGLPRNKGNTGFELLRYAVKLHSNVVGGFPKLLKAFKKDNTAVIYSFVNVRYFTGCSYANNGFTQVTLTAPNYFYFKQNTTKLESRRQYQKHLLSSKLACFDESLSEYTNMLNNGFYRIFDAGNLKMVLNVK